jgi:hypothetical protein
MTRIHVLVASALLLSAATVVTGSYAGPKKPKTPSPSPADTPFDKQAASSVLSSVDLGKCKSTNAPRGEGHVSVKFMPAGGAADAIVDKGPFMGTPTAKCIAKEFKKAKVPAFSGDTVQVGKTFKFE